MVFSSVSFLFFFLPILLLFYKIVPKAWRNGVLLIFSLIFYFFGEKWYLFLLLFSCVFNYGIGRQLDKENKKLYLIIGIVVDIGLLFYFKYMNFFLDTFTDIFNLGTVTLKIILPLGISFFTFQNVSYLIDVYRKDAEVERNVFTYTTYITLFPQLVAGPIVRYKDVAAQLHHRDESFDLFASGIRRFTLGLGKKVLIADILYNTITAIMAGTMTTVSYWLVAIMFSFQIYYDFSGYSDMAIGLGKMFGFEFLENFNYPFIANSVSEFWRRWHMSLSTFFKDYVYIPLGGNRCSLARNVFNIFVVWFLTGLWHGADWNFILWGLYFFVFLCFEKFVLKDKIKNGVLKHVYTGIVILISFVIFNVTDLSQLWTFLKGMFGIGVDFSNFETLYYLKNAAMILVVACLGMGPWLKNSIEILKKGKLKTVINGGEVLYVFLILLLSIAGIVSSSFNPFIYFRF